MQNYQPSSSNSKLRLRLLALAIASPLTVSTAMAQISGGVSPKVSTQTTAEIGEAVGTEISAEAKAEGNANLTTEDVEKAVDSELEGSADTAAENRAEVEAEARARKAAAAEKADSMKSGAAAAGDSMKAGAEAKVETGESAMADKASAAKAKGQAGVTGALGLGAASSANAETGTATMADKADAMKAGAKAKVETGTSAMADKASAAKAKGQAGLTGVPGLGAASTTSAETGSAAVAAENAAKAKAAATIEVPASEAATLRSNGEVMVDKTANIKDAMESKAEAAGKAVTTTTLSTGTVVKSILPTVSGEASADARVGDSASVTMDADVGVSGNSDDEVFTGATLLEPLEKTTVDGYAALSGGIGDTETKAMKASRGDYNTHMTFATLPTGSYLPDVRVKVISAASGDLLLDAVSPGPLFYLQLPNGRYKVEASGYGEVKKKDFTISGSKSADLLLQWQAQ